MESYDTTSPAATPTAARAAALRALLCQSGYGGLNISLIVAHVERHGSAAGCQYVRTRDRAAVAELVGWHNFLNALNEPTAADWPAETDADRWELGPDPTEAAAAIAETRQEALPCA